MKKLIKKIPLVLIILLQASFLFAILLEKFTAIPVLLFALVLLVLLIVAYKRVPMHNSKHLKRDFFALVYVVAGAFLTFYINIEVGLGPVIAAASVGTVASFVPLLNRRSTLLQEAPAAVYCGAFVGMSSQRIAGGFMFILIASVIAGLLLVFSKNIFRGFGGKLGTVAFGGVAVAYLLIIIFLGAI